MQQASSTGIGSRGRTWIFFFPRIREIGVRRAVVLMGPRRVGKTVMIHHAIQALLDEGVFPKSICYFSVDSPIYNTLGIDKFLYFYSKSTVLIPPLHNSISSSTKFNI